MMLVYGFPGTVLGFALKYAELLPVTLRSQPEAVALREDATKGATYIHNMLRKDCTRYRYGDEQHLDEALERLFLFGRPGGIPRRASPKLVGIREERRPCPPVRADGSEQTSSGDAYALVLEFESPRVTDEQWEAALPRFQSFFGPGLVATLEPRLGGSGGTSDDSVQGKDVVLVSDGSGLGKDKPADDLLVERGVKRLGV